MGEPRDFIHKLVDLDIDESVALLEVEFAAVRAEGAAAERARIVAWLRAHGAEYDVIGGKGWDLCAAIETGEQEEKP